MKIEVDMKSFEKTDIPYSDIPWHRKRWFIVTMFFIAIPITLIIILTGDVYAQIDGITYKYTEKQKKNMILMGIFFMLFGLFKLFFLIR